MGEAKRLTDAELESIVNYPEQAISYQTAVEQRRELLAHIAAQDAEFARLKSPRPLADAEVERLAEGSREIRLAGSLPMTWEDAGEDIREGYRCVVRYLADNLPPSLPLAWKTPELMFTSGPLRDAASAGWHSARGEATIAAACIDSAKQGESCDQSELAELRAKLEAAEQRLLHIDKMRKIWNSAKYGSKEYYQLNSDYAWERVFDQGIDAGKAERDRIDAELAMYETAASHLSAMVDEQASNMKTMRDTHQMLILSHRRLAQEALSISSRLGIVPGSQETIEQKLDARDAELAEAKRELAVAKEAGLIIGTIKEAGKESRLTWDIADGSPLAKEVEGIEDLTVRNFELEQQLAATQAKLNRLVGACLSDRPEGCQPLVEFLDQMSLMTHIELQRRAKIIIHRSKIYLRHLQQGASVSAPDATEENASFHLEDIASECLAFLTAIVPVLSAGEEGCWPKRELTRRLAMQAEDLLLRCCNSTAPETPRSDEQAGGEESDGAALIVAERRRQVEQERWDAGHDDEHDLEELARAAACYAVGKPLFCFDNGRHWDIWPFAPEWDKRGKHPRIKQLAISGALCAAEIDRLLRLQKSEPDHIADAGKKVDAESDAAYVSPPLKAAGTIQVRYTDGGRLKPLPYKDCEHAPTLGSEDGERWKCPHCGSKRLPYSKPDGKTCATCGKRIEDQEQPAFVCPKCGGTAFIQNHHADYVDCMSGFCRWFGTWADVRAAREPAQPTGWAWAAMWESK